MKNLLKKLRTTALSLLTLGALSAPALAVNLDELIGRSVDGMSTAENVMTTNSQCATFFYTGTSTEALLNVDGTNMSAYAPYNVADTTFGNSGTYALSASAYDTMGEVCDAINAAYALGTNKYRCSLNACKRDDNSTLLRDQTETSGTNNLGAAGGATLKFDNGAAHTGVASATYLLSIGITPATGRRVLLKQCKANSNGTGTLQVYGQLRKYANAADGVTRDDTTSVWSEPTVDDTTLTETWAITGAGGVEFAKDQHVVIRATDGSSAEAAANFLNCNWEEK